MTETCADLVENGHGTGTTVIVALVPDAMTPSLTNAEKSQKAHHQMAIYIKIECSFI